MHISAGRGYPRFLSYVFAAGLLFGCATTPGRDKPLDPVMAVAAAPREDLIAVSTDSSEVALFNGSPLRFRSLLTPEGAKTKPAFEELFLSPCVAFSPDGAMLVAAGLSGHLVGWDVHSGSQRFKTLLGERVSDVAFFPDGRRFVTAGSGAVLWEADTGERAGALLLPAGGPSVSVAVSPDGQVVLVGLSNGDIAVYHAATQEFARAIKAHKAAVTGLAFAPDGRAFASCGGRYDPRIWEIPEGLSPAESASGAALTSPSPKASSGAVDAIVFLAWLLGTARGFQMVGAPTLGVPPIGSGQGDTYGTTPPKHCGPRLAFSPDGRYLAAIANVSSISGEWDLMLIDRVSHETKRITGVLGCAVAFTGDGKCVVTGGAGAPQLWDIATGKRSHE